MSKMVEKVANIIDEERAKVDATNVSILELLCEVR